MKWEHLHEGEKNIHEKVNVKDEQKEKEMNEMNEKKMKRLIKKDE